MESRPVSCDVVFVGAFLSNLLSATSLIERFESIRIKILETTERRPPVPSSVTAVSPDAWGDLTERYPHLTKAILRRGLFLNGGGAAVTDGRQNLKEMQSLVTENLCDLLIETLPSDVLCQGQVVRRIEETADLVIAETQTGVVYETKLLIMDKSVAVGTADNSSVHFAEVTFSANNCLLASGSKWSGNDVYICHDMSNGGLQIVSCLLRIEDLSMHSVLEKLCTVPGLEDSFSGVEAQLPAVRPLRRNICDAVRGRVAPSSEFSSSIPHFSPLKMEYELEEALHLKCAILQKGLTAAALSDWKRRQALSARTQFLKEIHSPMELFPVAEDVLNNGHRSKAEDSGWTRNQTDRNDIGKPLVCSPVKPYMALMSND